MRSRLVSRTAEQHQDSRSSAPHGACDISRDALERRLAVYVAQAATSCPTLRQKTVTRSRPAQPAARRPTATSVRRVRGAGCRYPAVTARSSPQRRRLEIDHPALLLLDKVAQLT